MRGLQNYMVTAASAGGYCPAEAARQVHHAEEIQGHHHLRHHRLDPYAVNVALSPGHA
jgi:hypothetical protein